MRQKKGNVEEVALPINPLDGVLSNGKMVGGGQGRIEGLSPTSGGERSGA